MGLRVGRDGEDVASNWRRGRPELRQRNVEDGEGRVKSSGSRVFFVLHLGLALKMQRRSVRPADAYDGGNVSDNDRRQRETGEGAVVVGGGRGAEPTRGKVRRE